MPEIESQVGVLREVANFLRTLTAEQVDQLNSGEARIVLEQRTGRSRKGGVANQRLQNVDLTGVRAILQDMNSREEGRAFLDELRLPRSALQEFAHSLDMLVNKSDTVDKLKDLVVEATIGYRLRSNAIRGGDTRSVEGGTGD